MEQQDNERKKQNWVPLYTFNICETKDYSKTMWSTQSKKIMHFPFSSFKNTKTYPNIETLCAGNEWHLMSNIFFGWGVVQTCQWSYHVTIKSIVWDSSCSIQR